MADFPIRLNELARLKRARNMSCAEWLKGRSISSLERMSRMECLPILDFQIFCLILLVASSLVLVIRGGKTLGSVYADVRILFRTGFDACVCLFQPCVSVARKLKRRGGRAEKYSPLATTSKSSARDVHPDRRGGEGEEEGTEDLVSPEVVTSGARRKQSKEPDRRPAMVNKVQEQELIPLSTAASEMPD
jgi:hypothetical protein